jgi:hypothetical protein
MLMPVYELGVGNIPVGAVVHVERRGMEWCTDTKGNVYELDEAADEFIALVSVALEASDQIYTGTRKDKRCPSGKARSYSWRLPMNWTISLARSTTSG